MRGSASVGGFSTSLGRFHIFKDYGQSKMLPHINEEYEFRITNKLLVQKITNPRRDKIIIDSLMNASAKYLHKRKKTELTAQKSIIHRRKMLGNRSLKKQDRCAQTDQFARDTHQIEVCRESRFSKFYEKDEKEGKNNLEYLSKTCDFTQSKIAETRQNSMRDNFVGRIVRNKQKRKQGSHGLSLQITANNDVSHTNYSHFHQEVTSPPTTSHQNLKGKETLKKIVRRANYLKTNLQDKENLQETVQHSSLNN